MLVYFDDKTKKYVNNLDLILNFELRLAVSYLASPPKYLSIWAGDLAFAPEFFLSLI